MGESEDFAAADRRAARRPNSGSRRLRRSVGSHPFVVDRPVLLAAVLGHVVAVTVVSATAIALSLVAE